MAKKIVTPEAILTTRMALQIPENNNIRFSTLDFPFANAFASFRSSFNQIYERQHGEQVPYHLQLPSRQLNDAILALAPGLIQAFESTNDDNEFSRRLVAFTHYGADGNPQDVPTLGQLRSVIRHWAEQWSEHPEVQSIVIGNGKMVWQALMKALNGDPEAGWQHGITPMILSTNPGGEKGLAYIALPALLTALLHEKRMTINSEKGTYHLTWRRVNDGDKNGLHIVSNPIRYKDDYFAYRLDFSVQTQAGYVDEHGQPRLWIFAHVSIQRYMSQKIGSKKEDRAISVLVGLNREKFNSTWETDTTLVNLRVKKEKDGWGWESGVGSLLNSLSMRKLLSPDDLFSAPQNYGNYAGLDNFNSDEYYPVYAEGRTFGEESERKHQVYTGTTLRERSQLIEGVLNLLDGWLQAAPPLRKDVQNPENTFALRDYDYMVDGERKDQSKQRASWLAMLKTVLNAGGHQQMHIVALWRSDRFRNWAEIQINETLMGANEGGKPLVTVTLPDNAMPPMLYSPIDTAELPSDYPFLPRDQKTREKNDRWKVLMREGYATKRTQWRDYLKNMPWKPGSRRLILIDSTGEFGIPTDRKIKGAIRDACHREGILSQFIVGDSIKMDRKDPAILDGASSGKLKNAVLDLVLRQQGLLYAPPSEIYEKAAGLDSTTANSLYVVAFCRVERSTPTRIRYVLAVRLRASGQVDVKLPGDSVAWLPYDAAAHALGYLFSEQRITLMGKSTKSPLRLGNDDMLNFVYNVLTQQLDRPTIAVIEAAGWRNSRSKDDQKQCWIQLQNKDIYRYRNELRFDSARNFDRSAPLLGNLLAVVRLRTGRETPQYVTAADWADEEPMRDIKHLTGYVDPCVLDLMHYFSVAGLPETQKKQHEAKVMEQFRGDLKTNEAYDLAYKHPQLIEMVPFFVRKDFDSLDGRTQLCRCIHLLRISPAFTMGDIVQAFPMHLGETLIEDQLAIINADL